MATTKTSRSLKPTSTSSPVRKSTTKPDPARRIAQGLKNGGLKAEEFLVKQNGVLVKVLCRVCGATIRDTLEVGEPKVETKGNQTVITKRVMLGILPNYREVTVECCDKSKHVFNLCSNCATPEKLTPEVLEAIYCVDLRMFPDFNPTRQPLKILEIYTPSGV